MESNNIPKSDDKYTLIGEGLNIHNELLKDTEIKEMSYKLKKIIWQTNMNFQEIF